MSKRRKRTESKGAVRRTAELLSQAYAALGKKARKTREHVEKRYAQVVDRYIKEAYLPKGTGARKSDIVSAADRRYIADRTSVRVVAQRHVNRKTYPFRKGSDKGEHAGEYLVTAAYRKACPRGRLKVGEWASPEDVRRSMKILGYWRQVRILREALDNEITASDARAILRGAQAAEIADASVLIAETSGVVSLKGRVAEYKREKRIAGKADAYAKKQAARGQPYPFPKTLEQAQANHVWEVAQKRADAERAEKRRASKRHR